MGQEISERKSLVNMHNEAKIHFFLEIINEAMSGLRILLDFHS